MWMMSLGVSESEEKASFFSFFFFFFFFCVGFRFVNNWNPIFKIHFLIFLNFLGNQIVDIPLFSYLYAVIVFMGILIILIIGWVGVYPL